MAGSNVYCTVLKESSGPTVACFLNSNPSSSTFTRKGYAIVASDGLVGVEPSGSTRPVLIKTQPSFAKVPPIGGGKAYGESRPVELGADEAIEVGGSHMMLLLKKFSSGGNSIVIVDIDAHGNLINGSYATAIGAANVVVARVSGQQFKPVYQHPVA
jgi:hypothetical protein